jgi:hypothetical protein
VITNEFYSIYQVAPNTWSQTLCYRVSIPIYASYLPLFFQFLRALSPLNPITFDLKVSGSFVGGVLVLKQLVSGSGRSLFDSRLIRIFC